MEPTCGSPRASPASHLLAATSGCGTARQGAPDGATAPQQRFSAAQTVIVGARPPEERALRGALRELAPTQIDRILLSDKAAPRLGVAAGMLALRIDLAAPSVHADWEARTLGYLYLVAVRRLDLRAIEVIAAGDDHEPASRFVLAKTHAAESLPGIRHAVAATPARVIELRSVASRTLALTVQTTNPARFLKHDAGPILGRMNRASPNQLYFGVEGSSGAVVYAIEWTGYGGRFYSRPDLRACGPVMTFMGFDAPRCTA